MVEPETMEHVCASVGVGDGVVDTVFISGVGHQPIATIVALDVDPSFIDAEFMPKYEETFGDKCAEDWADDRLVPELSKRDKTLL
jgi:hypothetical protein